MIKLATSEDTETISSILREAADWLVSRGMPLWQSDELSPEKISGEVEKGLFWLAQVNNKPAGCVRFQLEDQLFWPDIPIGESAFIHKLAVRRRFSGGVLSSQILQWAKNETKLNSRQFLRLDCESKAAKLRKFYERNGFALHSTKQVGPYLVARYECDCH